MPSYAPSKLILVFIVSVILLYKSTTSIALNQTINIGVIIDEASREGKEEKTAIQIAVQKLNSASKTHKLAIHFKNSNGDPLEAASSASDLIDKENVKVIVGTGTWEETTVVARIGEHAKIPVISLTADSLQPQSRLQWPFLVQMTNLDIHDEIKCITFIVQSYNWKRIIAVHEDNMCGDEFRAVSLLSEALQKIGSFIEHSVVVPHSTSSFDPEETIRESLVNVLTTKQSRVFILLKSSLPVTNQVFKEANKLGLMGQGSVWILGDSFSSFLDSLDASAFQLMQGALGVKTYYSDESTQFQDFKSTFKTSFRSSYPEEDKPEPGIFALRAYDSIETISLALDRLGKLKDIQGNNFLDAILSTNISSFTGRIDIHGENLSESEVFQLVNIIGKSYKELGFWSRASGFSKRLGSGDHRSLNQLPIHWPGDLSRTPKGWAMPSAAMKMKIGVPDAPSFDRYVKVEWIESSNKTKYSGFCIEVFEYVVAVLEEKYGYTLPYEFTNHTGSYDNMVDQVYNKKYDAVVGDVTILYNRSRYVEFTHPFIESRFSMVVPVISETQNAWKFMKPFTVEMWLGTFGIMLYTVLVVWFMEHQVNPEFRGPWKHQLGNALWITFSSLFFAHREKIINHHSKVVVMIWLFVVFIISSSYTASLTSMLTVRILEPTVSNIEWLRKNNAPVGCDPNSFVGKYLTDVLNLKNVINISHQDKYRENFKKGNIRAAFLELSFQKYFLKEYCNEYTVVGPTYKFGGLGFVFPKDSPITSDASGAILSLLEDGKIRDLESKWLDPQNCSSSNVGLEAERLSLTNFWGIFLISGLTSTLSLLIFIYRLLHSKIVARIRWRKAIRKVQIGLNWNHNQQHPRENLESTNEWEWDPQNPPKWERVSPTEVPEHLEIGRPTQLEIPMMIVDHICED